MHAPLKKIFITGAGGMLGTDLCVTLQKHFQIAGAGILPAPHLSVPHTEIDLGNVQKTAELIKRYEPQVVFHCAAFTDVDAYEQRPDELLHQNALLIESVVNAANQAGAFLIFFSSDYVFNGQKKGEYLEDDPRCPMSVYGKSKADAETYIQKNASRYSIFRISWLYGMRGKSFPRTIWEKASVQNSFKVVHDQVGRPTYTRDIADAFEQILCQKNALERMNGQIFHLTNSGRASWAELAEFILTLHTSHGTVERISSDELNRPAKRPANSLLSLEKTASILNVRLRDWKPAVEEFLRELAGKPSL